MQEHTESINPTNVACSGSAYSQCASQPAGYAAAVGRGANGVHPGHVPPRRLTTEDLLRRLALLEARVQRLESRNRPIVRLGQDLAGDLAG